MVLATSNRLLPILAGAMVLMLAFVGLKSCSGDSADRAVLDQVPQAPAPDADTPADTIKTLTANVAAMTAEVEALRRDNTTLRSENQQLLTSRTQIEENVTTRIKRDLLAREHDNEARQRLDQGLLSSLTARMDSLSQSIAQADTSRANDIPVGLGLDGISDETSLIWIDPLDTPEPESNTGQGSRLLQPVRHAAGGAFDNLGQKMAERMPEKAETITRGVRDRAGLMIPRPVYTVPRNATLIGSTAMTALVGRVPVQGEVRDPMPFKVITGADNLAANGLTVPGVQGMVWSGTAIGDWTLSCVTGRLDSVTFVFDDGTIRTISGDERGGSGRGGNETPLGWVSDARGIPCISGDRKTNAPAFLSQRIGVTAIQAAAEAAAAAQTTRVVSDTGTATENLTGDAGRFVLGKTLAGGSEEVAQWLKERQAQGFDAVFVPAGTEIAIHVDRELPIDFDPSGRRLTHATTFDPSRRTRLD